MLARVNKLWSTLYPSTESTGWTNNSNSSNKHHRSWLHKVGQVAGTVGGLTLRSMSGVGGYGMGGYGYPMW